VVVIVIVIIVQLYKSVPSFVSQIICVLGYENISKSDINIRFLYSDSFRTENVYCVRT
jgi:hypothetical protein